MLTVEEPTRVASRALARVVLVVSLAGCGAAPPVPTDDGDRDGVRGALDRCPAVPEDLDAEADSDGCPESTYDDRDGDGRREPDDACPDDPEDLDGVSDADGCPDADDDGDGVADVSDLCACVAEDPDRFEDHDGCPEPDNDRDGLPDACDQCPNEPETFQGSCDEDGCPDRSRICITQERVTIPGLVPFDASASRLAESTAAMLDTVAESLRASPEIERVAVRGRATTRERRAAALARARAEAVVEALVQRGVDRSRLEAVGLDPATTAPAAVAGGRFVELVVVRFAGEEWPEGQPPPSSTHGCGPVICEPVPPCAPPRPPRPAC